MFADVCSLINVFSISISGPEDVGISSTIIHGPQQSTIADQIDPTESIIQSAEDSGIFARSGDNHRRIIIRNDNDIESVTFETTL